MSQPKKFKKPLHIFNIEAFPIPTPKHNKHKAKNLSYKKCKRTLSKQSIKKHIKNAKSKEMTLLDEMHSTKSMSAKR